MHTIRGQMVMSNRPHVIVLFLQVMVFFWHNHNMTVKGDYVNSSASLEKWLSYEEGQKNSNTHIFLELDSTIEYQLAPNNFSVFKNVNITIISDSNDKSIDIHCSDGLHYHRTRGLGFVNSTITMKRVAFHNCGMNLRAIPRETLQVLHKASKPFHYSSNMASVILLIESRALFSYVSFNSSYGFAIIGFNLINSLFEYGMVYHSMNLKKEITIHSIGSGIMIHFGNKIKCNSSLQAGNVSYSVNLLRMILKDNFDYHSKSNCNPYPSYYSGESHIRVPNAPGLTILISKQTAQVIINETRFSRNIGSYYGSVLIMNFENVIKSSIYIKNTLFEKSGKFRYTGCHGDALRFLWFWRANDYHFIVSELFVIENVTFSNNTGKETWNEVEYYANDLIRIETYVQNISITYKIKTLLCISNTVEKIKDSACLTINRQPRYLKCNVKIVMENTTAKNNFELGGKLQRGCIFKFSKVVAKFVGISHFSDNFGSVICGVDSGIHLHGQMTFINNVGINGGALRIEGYGILDFTTGVQLMFINNTAYSAGGAIYVNSYSDFKCGLQTTDPTPTNVSFINNTAKLAGSSLFLTPLHKCIDNNIYRNKKINHLYRLLHLSKIPEPRGTPFQLSTAPTNFAIHYPKNLTIYPGEIVSLTISSVDHSHRHRVVFSVFEIELYSIALRCHKNNNLRIWLQQYGTNSVVENTIHQPPFNISVHTNNITEQKTYLIISILNIHKKILEIHLLKCPLGFAISEWAGSCECDKIFQNIEHYTTKVKCHISHKTIRRPKYINFWLGSINNSYTGLSSSCPTTYCAFEPTYKYIKSTKDDVVLTDHGQGNNTRPFCSYNRTGTICGTCDPKYNLSVVFGTSECRECSDVWLFTIPIYAIAGLVLIIILYSLNLTLTTGKLNGIIFYAQIANAGLMESLSLPIYTGRYSTMGHVRHFCVTLLSLLNLNLGYPICFYNGMNQLWKTGLSFVFPVYLLLIVVLIIVISRYSTWLSNKTSHSSVQVLVTVVHLSFSKLLLALIDVFTPATVYVSDKPPLRVWYWDGSVQYMTDHGHLLLAIISVLIVSVCLIPYVSILILGKVIIRYSKRGKLYLRPVYEAIHAPYKEGKQLWFVARLIILVLIYLLYVFFRTRNISILYILIVSLLAMYLIGQTVFRPYKSKCLVILDCWLLVNIIMIFVALRTSITSTNATNFILVAVILALASFTIVLIHHVCMRNAHIRAVLLKFKTLIQHTRMPHQQILTSRPNELQSASYYESCDECREPLLDQLIDKSYSS